MSRTFEYDTGGDEPVELEMDFGDFFPDSVEVVQLPDRFLVGYLTPDEDCPSPEDADAVGYIYSSDRDYNREMHENFQDALGLTSDWEPRVTVWGVVSELADELGKDDGWDLLRPEPPADFDAYFELRRKLTRADLKLPYRRRFDALWEEHRKDGDLGDPDRVTLDVYKHGGTVYHVGYNPNFPDRQWDCAYGGAVWVPDKYLRQEAEGLSAKDRRAKMVEWAEQAVEQMNDWMNGGCYCVVTQTNALDGSLIDSDSCGGFIGEKWAEEERDRDLKYEQEHLKPLETEAEDA